jgi:RNA-directed DNA polymerase
MIAYADDFIVTATSRELLENKVMPTLVESLAKVGLKLSPTKTKITHIDTGFDFLGFNVRKYKNGKLLIKPAKENIKRFLQEIRTTIKKGVALPTEQLIHTLNLRLTGWVNYYRTSVSSKVFSYVDSEIFKSLMRWACKRHTCKGKRWIVDKYFTTLKGDNWRFHCIIQDKQGNSKPLYLRKAGDTKIRRHVKIKSEATPFNPLFKDYFKQREEERKRRKTIINYNDFAGLRTIQPY